MPERTIWPVKGTAVNAGERFEDWLADTRERLDLPRVGLKKRDDETETEFFLRKIRREGRSDEF